MIGVFYHRPSAIVRVISLRLRLAVEFSDNILSVNHPITNCRKSLVITLVIKSISLRIYIRVALVTEAKVNLWNLLKNQAIFLKLYCRHRNNRKHFYFY